MPERRKGDRQPKRCPWASTPSLIAYHDSEWGIPVHDDQALFEMLVLEGAQAGLSWETVLRKRERYRELFGGFDPSFVANITPSRVKRMMLDPGIIRNQAKIEAAIGNARALLFVRQEFGSFDVYIWRFVGGKTIVHSPRRPGDVPASSAESEAMSRDLRKRGFRFVGPTICYAFMQAVGMVNDHFVNCAWR
jgi:DNA-3-methyladenine glycosylase I